MVRVGQHPRQGCLGLFRPQVTILLVFKAVGQQGKLDNVTRMTYMPAKVQSPGPSPGPLEVQKDPRASLILPLYPASPCPATPNQKDAQPLPWTFGRQWQTVIDSIHLLSLWDGFPM